MRKRLNKGEKKNKKRGDKRTEKTMNFVNPTQK